MSNDSKTFLKFIILIIATGLLTLFIDVAVGSPDENSIKGQLIPVIAIAFVIIILLTTGIIKLKK